LVSLSLCLGAVGKVYPADVMLLLLLLLFTLLACIACIEWIDASFCCRCLGGLSVCVLFTRYLAKMVELMEMPCSHGITWGLTW